VVPEYAPPAVVADILAAHAAAVRQRQRDGVGPSQPYEGELSEAQLRRVTEAQDVRGVVGQHFDPLYVDPDTMKARAAAAAEVSAATLAGERARRAETRARDALLDSMDSSGRRATGRLSESFLESLG
jgi:hypothetical protein